MQWLLYYTLSGNSPAANHKILDFSELDTIRYLYRL